MTPPTRSSRRRSVASADRTAKQAPSRRIPWGTLSRAQIVDAATAVVRRGDYEQMTIRSLASELGTAPMSLYRHVRDRDDILDEVVDRLLARVWRPHVSEDGWSEWVAAAADKLRAFLVAEPAALHVYLRHPVVSPSAVQRMEAMMDVLRSVGLAEEDARKAYAAIHTYTVGFAALEASRAHSTTVSEAPNELALELAAYATPRQFRHGLQLIMDAVARQVG